MCNANIAWKEASPNVIMFWDGDTPLQISSGVNNADEVYMSNGHVIYRPTVHVAQLYEITAVLLRL